MQRGDIALRGAHNLSIKMLPARNSLRRSITSAM
jgi:hypothetical protein